MAKRCVVKETYANGEVGYMSIHAYGSTPAPDHVHTRVFPSKKEAKSQIMREQLVRHGVRPEIIEVPGGS